MPVIGVSPRQYGQALNVLDDHGVALQGISVPLSAPLRVRCRPPCQATTWPDWSGEARTSRPMAGPSSVVRSTEMWLPCRAASTAATAQRVLEGECGPHKGSKGRPTGSIQRPCGRRSQLYLRRRRDDEIIRMPGKKVKMTDRIATTRGETVVDGKTPLVHLRSCRWRRRQCEPCRPSQ
jgi:hypothetical protein